MDTRIVLVTGGTRGLGLALAKRLSQDGYTVIATGRRLSDDLKVVIEACTDDGGIVHFEPLDLKDFDAFPQFITRLTRQYGGLYGLVNNAAIAHDGILGTMHASQVIETIQINVTGTILLTKYALRPMLVNRNGRIINISSIIGHTGFNGLSVYGASKAALFGFTRSLARELGRANITVNAVAPGYMETHMSAGLDDGKLETIRRRTPMGRLATVDEVSGAISFLLTDDARMITGTIVTVDGGSTA